MRTDKTLLFTKCPLCGQAEISVEKRGHSIFSKPKISHCPKCSAEFAVTDTGKIQLVLCEPHKLAPRHRCMERLFRGCYLGATLSKSEWETIADGGESLNLKRSNETGTEFRHGLLPTRTSEEMPFSLGPNEIVHYVSSPVYLDEQKPCRRVQGKGDLFLTNKRIVYKSTSRALTISLENIGRVEKSPPGFLIKQKDSFEPVYFFPPLYDPVLHAVLGAMRNSKEKR